jgi:YHS domain-containing protein
MTWLYEGKPYEPEELDPKKIYGFVYLIENLETGKKYIGKKLLFASKTRQVNKKKKRYKAESDWKTYYGSSESLLEDVKTFGKDKFRRTILHLCASKAECSYLEAKEQFEREVLLSDNYYNSWISVRVRQAHLKGLQIPKTVL